jgi:hypothetical protein
MQLKTLTVMNGQYILIYMSETTSTEFVIARVTWPLRILCFAAGIPNATLGTWRGRYGLKLAAEPGDGKARYGFQDVFRVVMVAELVGQEVSARRACKLVNQHFDLIGKIVPRIGDPQSLMGPFLVVDRPGVPFRKEVSLIEGPGALLDALLDTGSSGTRLVVNLSAIARRVTRSVSVAHRQEEAEEDQDLPLEDRAKATWDKSPAIRNEFFGSFEQYLAYRMALEAGAIRFY